jgi:hypothetical protein
MPIKKTIIKGKLGYKWGEHGKIYFGTQGYNKARKQGIAIKISQSGRTKRSRPCAHVRTSVRGKRFRVNRHICKKMNRKAVWKPTSGDFDVSDNTYNIDYGECQICGKKLHSKDERKKGLCHKCELDELKEVKGHTTNPVGDRMIEDLEKYKKSKRDRAKLIIDEDANDTNPEDFKKIKKILNQNKINFEEIE